MGFDSQEMYIWDAFQLFDVGVGMANQDNRVVGKSLSEPCYQRCVELVTVHYTDISQNWPRNLTQIFRLLALIGKKTAVNTLFDQK